MFQCCHKKIYIDGEPQNKLYFTIDSTKILKNKKYKCINYLICKKYEYFTSFKEFNGLCQICYNSSKKL